MKAKKWLLPIISVTIIIIALSVASYLVGDDAILPSPLKVFGEFFALFKKSVFYKEVASDLWRTTSSFILSLVFAVVFAVITSMSETLERLLYPIVVSLRAIPTIAIILWCLIIFKTDKSPSAVSFIVMFPTLYGAVSSAISSRDKKLDLMVKVYGVKRSDYIFKVLLPDITGRVFSQVCSLFSFNVKLIVAGEALSYTKLSLGRELQIANINLETAKLLALTLVVIIISVFAEILLKTLGKSVKRGIYGYNRKKINEVLR